MSGPFSTWSRSERGATMVESAIAFPIYLMLLLLSFDILRVCYCRLSLQFAVTAVAREATLHPGIDPKARLQQQLTNFGIAWTPASDKFTVCPRSRIFSDCTAGTTNRGVPLEPMAFKADMQVNLLLPGSSTLLTRGGLVLSTTVLGKNEPE
ncbi:MAG: TadE family protein [Bdellovibrionota bacterium]